MAEGQSGAPRIEGSDRAWYYSTGMPPIGSPSSDARAPRWCCNDEGRPLPRQGNRDRRVDHGLNRGTAMLCRVPRMRMTSRLVVDSPVRQKSGGSWPIGPSRLGGATWSGGDAITTANDRALLQLGMRGDTSVVRSESRML